MNDDQTQINIPALIEILSNHADLEVRLDAVGLLGESGDARAIEPLIATLADDTNPAMREGSAQALGALLERIESPRAIAALLHALREDSDWGTRQSAAESMIVLENEFASEGEALLLNDLHHAEAEVRLGAAWSLILLGDQRAVETLQKLRDNPNPDIALMAARGLEFLP